MSAIEKVVINLDKERHLRLTLGGMKKFQEVTDKSLLKGFDFENADEADLIALIWACLIWEDRNLSLEDVGYMLDVSKLGEIAQKLKQAIEQALPKREEGQDPNPQKLPTG